MHRILKISFVAFETPTIIDISGSVYYLENDIGNCFIIDIENNMLLCSSLVEKYNIGKIVLLYMFENNTFVSAGYFDHALFVTLFTNKEFEFEKDFIRGVLH